MSAMSRIDFVALRLLYLIFVRRVAGRRFESVLP
jgi:hypothetical protein